MTLAIPRLAAVSLPAQTHQESLDLKARIVKCVSRFHGYQSQGRISNRNQRLFGDLELTFKPALRASLPLAFESNPRVIRSVTELESHLDAVMNGGKATPALELKIATVVTSILSRYGASLPKAPVNPRVGNGVSLQRFGVDNDIENEICRAMDLLRELGKDNKVKEFTTRLANLRQEIVLGAVSELRVIYQLLQLSERYEILDVNCQLNQNTLEFFDVVVRDRKTDRLVLIETKRGGCYNLGTFLAQFLGIGRERRGGHTTCQTDALLHPERYLLLTSKPYFGDISSGNFEVWVVSEDGFAAGDFDSTLTAVSGVKITNVLCYLTHHHTNIRSMQTSTDVDLRKITEEVLQMIRGTSLEQTIIKFRTLYSIQYDKTD